MKVRFAILLGILASAAALAAGAINVDAFKQLANKRLMALKPAEAAERQVLFQDVRPAGVNGNIYKFEASILVRDYDPGFPRNRYYGQTCVGKIQNATFTVSLNNAGEWQAEGVMTPPVRDCKPNPAQGVTSVPLASLPGTPAPGGLPAGPGAGAAAQGKVGGLPMGEWACYRGGRTVVIAYGFKLQAGGTYTDLDNKTRGTYQVSADSVTFRGGHLDGQVAKRTGPNEIGLVNGAISCQPWTN